ncbi:MAG: class I SAM-dependent methyltransferase [Ignavibacteria bacterium]|nr:class I SAM-dependent methyltransferase [Ignavibacteria bacterium]
MRGKRTTGDHAAKIGMTILQFLLKDYHPRDFSIRLWDGSVWNTDKDEPRRFSLVIHHPEAIRTMLTRPGERSLGEAYIYNDFDIEGSLEHAFPIAEHLLRLRLRIADRLRLATLLLRLPSTKSPRSGRQALKPRGDLHSIERDREVVTYHYDTSSDFFALYLDKQMVYSSAYFTSPDEDLGSAQERKLDYICRKLRLRPGERFLDIGCGWGALIIHATQQYGVFSLGITLSEPQAKLANERIQKRGLGDRCRVEVRDYRQIDSPSSFDKMASIGMVEHVGERKLPEYFNQAWRLLRPGGVFLNHGIAYRREESTHRHRSFSQAYVFPDGDPVSIDICTRIAEDAGFELRDVESLREHYALTLRHWVRRLESHHAEAVRATDEATYRVWRLFMSASAHAFETGRYSIYQSLLSKPNRGRSELPLTRADWYR